MQLGQERETLVHSEPASKEALFSLEIVLLPLPPYPFTYKQKKRTLFHFSPWLARCSTEVSHYVSCKHSE